jgi:nitric-oxide synthase, bacterial
VGLNQGSIAADSQWRIAEPSWHHEHGHGLPPGDEDAGFPCSGACLAASDDPDPDPGYVPELGTFGGDRFLAGDDSLAIDSLFASAERFITLFHTENRAGPPDRRLWQVRREIAARGTYRHTAAELEFGARVAWRNSSKCIGRLYWHSLRVRDRREVATAAEVAAESIAHLREATNGGRIRPTLTVFAPDAPGWPGPRIRSPQLVQYAGYETADGAVIGDPANVGITRLAGELGWPGGRPPGRFDILPLVIEEGGTRLELHRMPADAVIEVMIHHPEFAWFAGLGLRWFAVPVISDMYLEIGGVCYPAAPFNGWYMCTEIGSRDLGDTRRYDQLPVIARNMGLSMASDQTLWKDKAMTELNIAVLYSYAAAGVTITDHHTESVRFLQHSEREARHGRACPADWTWIVPPAASSATPVFHRYYQDFDASPNFYRHPAPPLAPSRFRGCRPGAAAC